MTLLLCGWLLLLWSGLLHSSRACKRLQALLLPGRALRYGYWVWKHRAFFWCLHLEATSPIALLKKKTKKNKQQKKGKSSFRHVYRGCCEATLFWCVCFCLSFLSLLLLLAQIVLLILLSVCCVHGDKKTEQKKADKRYETIEMSASVMQDWDGWGWWQIYTLEISVQRPFPCSTAGERPVFVRCILGLPGGWPINRQIYVTESYSRGTSITKIYI